MNKKLSLFIILVILSLTIIFALTATEVFYDGFEGAGYDFTTNWTAAADYTRETTNPDTGTYSNKKTF